MTTKREYDKKHGIEAGNEPDYKICEDCYRYFGYWLDWCPDCAGMGVMDSMEADGIIARIGIDLGKFGKKCQKLVDEHFAKLSGGK